MLGKNVTAVHDPSIWKATRSQDQVFIPPCSLLVLGWLWGWCRQGGGLVSAVVGSTGPGSACLGLLLPLWLTMPP